MGDGHIWFELFIIVLLVLGNAVCSLAEIAIVGARKTKLQELADEGKRGAAQALKLTGRKEELFSTIQVGDYHHQHRDGYVLRRFSGRPSC